MASTHEACQMKARENCEGGTNVVIIGKQIVRVSISIATKVVRVVSRSF